MSLQTTVGVARPESKSLRVTVPEGVVAYLDLRAGDKLEWKMEVAEGEKIVIVWKTGATDSEIIKIASRYAKPEQR